MKMKSFYLLPITLIVLLLPGISQARWLSTEIGRFTTMDTFPGDQQEPKSQHKYAYCEDNPVNNIDPSGHEVEGELTVINVSASLGGMPNIVSGAGQTVIRRQIVNGTIWYDVGFDTSIKDTSGFQSKLGREFRTLDTVLTSSCPKWGILWLGKIKATYDWEQKAPPSPSGYSDNNWPSAKNFGINGHAGGIPLLLTTLPLKSNFEGNVIDANAFTRQNVGIICNLASSVDNTIAHETGHYAGYSGGDRDDGEHSSDPNNVMFAGGYYQNALQGDKDYCQKVSALAR